MKRYLKNLMTAVCGSDPYRKELDRTKEEYRKTAERVDGLNEAFLAAEEKAAAAEALLEDYGKAAEKAESLLKEADAELMKRQGEVSSLQTLVENLRQRIDEKDAQIRMMDEEFKGRAEGFKRRIEGYSEQIARLQAELSKAKKRGRQVRAKKETTRQERKS